MSAAFNPSATALFIPQDTAYGTRYIPANGLAEILTGIAGTNRLSEDRMVFVRQLCNVAYPNGQPIPFPVGVARRTPVC